MFSFSVIKELHEPYRPSPGTDASGLVFMKGLSQGLGLRLRLLSPISAQKLPKVKARDAVLAICATNLWLLSAIYNITIVVSHVKGTTNVEADLSSRWCGSTQNSVNLQRLVDAPIWVDTHIDLTLINHDI